MKTINPVDAARVELLLADLRLPAIKLMWTKLSEHSDKEGWPAARFLAALAEHEIADRGRRRIERHLAEARLPVGKTFDSFDFEVVPMVSKAQVMALTSGDSGSKRAPISCCSGRPAEARAISRQPSASRSSRTDGAFCSCAPAISSNACRSRAANSPSKVRFELIGTRYERRSMLITANQPFGEWGKVFPDQAMTLAAIDRLVHHSTIFEMNVESYRRRSALDRKRGPRAAADTRDNQGKRLIDAQRQSKAAPRKNACEPSGPKAIMTSLPAAAFKL